VLALIVPTRLPASTIVALGAVAVVLVPLILSAPLLTLLAALVAVALVPLLSTLSRTALILVVLLSHGVSLCGHRGPLAV